MFSLNAHDRIHLRKNESFSLLNFIKHKSKKYKWAKRNKIYDRVR